tara:strand:- start:41 stop:685 length:645 start_codon:yes stop_codon:yes gene_type:complete
MDEEITIINSNTRNEKIKNFFIENKKILILISSIVTLSVLIFYSYEIYKNGQREILANKYNNAIVEYENKKETKIILSMKEIIQNKDKTYSPLALYFLIDNDLITDENEINNFFDILINKTNLEKEIKNLIIYKKALYNSESLEENDLIKMLNPIIMSESIWRSHALYLMGEYFMAAKENQKAKEFFSQILTLQNSNNEIKLEAKKRLNRDLGE